MRQSRERIEQLEGVIRDGVPVSLAPVDEALQALPGISNLGLVFMLNIGEFAP